MSIRSFIDYLSYFEHRVAEGLSIAELGRRTAMSDSWCRKVRKGDIVPALGPAKQLGEAFELTGEDLDYWLALVAQTSEGLNLRSEARAFVWSRCDPALREAPESAQTAWLAEQPAATWALMRWRSCSEGQGAPADAALRLWPPMREEDAAATLQALDDRSLAQSPMSPWLQPRGTEVMRGHIRDALYAITDGWDEHHRFSMSLTFAQSAPVVARIRAHLHEYHAHLVGLGAEPQPVSVMSCCTILAPVTRDIVLTEALPSEEAPRPPHRTAGLSPMERALLNPAEMSYQDVVHARLRALGMQQRHLALAIGRSNGWLSRLLAYELEIHHADDTTLPAKLAEALQFTVTEASEFQALIDITHPTSERIRTRAFDFLEARARLGLALKNKRAERPMDSHQWCIGILHELGLLKALPSDPVALARLVVPPLGLRAAADVLANAIAPTSPLATLPSLPLGHPKNHAAISRHRGWFHTLERVLASPTSEADTWSSVVAIPQDGWQEARRATKALCDTLTQYAEPPSTGTARVYHLRMSLLRAAD